MPLVTIIYVLANIAYLAVLTPNDIIATKAIAVVSNLPEFENWNFNSGFYQKMDIVFIVMAEYPKYVMCNIDTTRLIFRNLTVDYMILTCV